MDSKAPNKIAPKVSKPGRKRDRTGRGCRQRQLTKRMYRSMMWKQMMQSQAMQSLAMQSQVMRRQAMLTHMMPMLVTPTLVTPTLVTPTLVTPSQAMHSQAMHSQAMHSQAMHSQAMQMHMMEEKQIIETQIMHTTPQKKIKKSRIYEALQQITPGKQKQKGMQPPPSTVGKPPPPPGTELLRTVPEVSVRLINAGFVELNSSNATQFVSWYGDSLLGGSPIEWHQITIKMPVLEKDRKSVISAINQRISPLKLTPYFFRMENNCITFFVNMCCAALTTLCTMDLKVPYTSDKFTEIELTIKPFTKNFDPAEALKEVVSRRLDSRKKFLDLSYINNIPEVREMLFHPTDNWHILAQMLRIADVTAPELAVLRLAGNGIAAPKSLWIFLVHCKWKSLRILDLSDNEIESTDIVALSRPLKISELYLDRNPICKIVNTSDYIRDIKLLFPCLTKLDGTYLEVPAGLSYCQARLSGAPFWKPNFIVGDTGDSGELADQFIGHFFTLYDDGDRTKLFGLYHENAYFSLNEQLTVSNASSSLTAYSTEIRNLLLCSDTKNARAALTRGSEYIIERLWNLPSTRHDPCTFTVDLTVHTLKLTVLTVTGVFCHNDKEDKSLYKHFSRTFVLTGRENGEYQITNDILYISSAATQEAEDAFMFVRPPTKITKIQPKLNLSECEKTSTVERVQQLTNMSAAWSQKYLEDNDWDLKKALQAFVVLYKINEIPESAFVNS